MYIMTGSTPDAVVTKYMTIIGNPILIPQWALGWN
jgi:alpha-glucosidase (family GH31 glycosyl hydrolase)